MNQQFPKSLRLRSRREFLNVQKHGLKVHSKHFIVVLYRDPTFKNGRFGITASKKVGNAVQRNRIKRLLREFFRLNKDFFSTNLNIVIIAKKNSHLLTFLELSNELLSLKPSIHKKVSQILKNKND